jgi:serine/threonine protein phosphatase PrpC
LAVRLQMKLGVVAEHDRIPDSPDTIIVVEPSVGSVARSKGHLYLLVTAATTGHRVQEATRLAAETIRNEYYYDESAGIRVCIEKAIAQANKRLLHQRDRLGLGHDGAGPIGVGVAVVRANELYVATVGPAEAYLIRQARLSTLPDPHRDRGLPADELEPDVWRGEISVGDSLVLVSPNIVSKLGVDELKDALVTLHPQSAMEHLHHRFIAADGAGSDGALAFEATEVTATSKHRQLVPVKPPEPLAGAPDRSPIPLADPVVDGVAAMQAGARAARDAAGSAFGRAILRIQDILPHRRHAPRRVTSLSARRETQRRAAVALLAFILVVSTLGLGVYLVGRPVGPDLRASISQAEAAIAAAEDALDQVSGPGIDLVANEPNRARELLTMAWTNLDAAEEAGTVAASRIDPLRARATEGFDRLYRVVPVNNRRTFAFKEQDPAIDLRSLVRGPDNYPYVLDRGTRTVYRIDVRRRRATVVVRQGQRAAGIRVAEPRFLTVGGPDLLILDARNALWRWRPADNRGRGTLTRVQPVSGAASWGNDIRAIGTFLRNADLGLYNLYLVDPSEEAILRYSPSADGAGFPQGWSNYLATARAVDGIDGLYIDGDVYVAENGGLERFASGKDDGWQAQPPGDEILRPTPDYVALTGGGDAREGVIYGYDPASQRIVALEKSDGEFVEQYRLAAGPEAWADLRGMYVIAGVDGEPSRLVWIAKDSLHESVLEAVEVEPQPSGSPPPSQEPGAPGSGEPSGRSSPRASPRP